MRRQFGLPKQIQVLSLFHSDAGIRAHPGYGLAKAGDPKAALDLVIDLAVGWLYANEGRFSLPCIFVAPHAKEVSGDNAIPQTLATVCATIFKATAVWCTMWRCWSMRGAIRPWCLNHARCTC